MGIISKISEAFSSDNKEETNDKLNSFIDLQKASIEKINVEIKDIEKSINENDLEFNSKIELVEKHIEKGHEDSKNLKKILEDKLEKSELKLISELKEKHAELEKAESFLNDLVKAEGYTSYYSDCIVRDKQGRILMLLRSFDDSFEPNKWGLPGGKIEQGENPSDAALRELKEETQLEAQDAFKISEKEHTDGSKTCYFDIYMDYPDVFLSSIGLDFDEHSNYCFMSLEEIKSRSDEDFIMDLKKCLLEMFDPQYANMSTISKGFLEGQISEDKFKSIENKYFSFKLNKKTEDK